MKDEVYYKIKKISNGYILVYDFTEFLDGERFFSEIEELLSYIKDEIEELM